MTATAAAAAAEAGGMTAMERVERLNHVISCLEEIRIGGGSGSRRWSSGGSNGGRSSSSASSSPTGRLRSVDEMIEETRVNGSLIDRISGLESRLLKLAEEVDNERKRESAEERIRPKNTIEKEVKQQHKKSFKSIVKTCVRGGQLKTKD